MDVKNFEIRKHDDSVDFFTLLGIYNKMTKYCNPTAIEINENFASAILGSNPDFSQKTLLCINLQNEIIGFSSIMKLPLYKNEWFVIYGVIPKYIESHLTRELMDATLRLGKEQKVQELYIQTTGEKSALFDESLENLGFTPIHYYYYMILDDFGRFSLPKDPQGIDIQSHKNIEDYESIVVLLNEAFKDAFLWKPLKARKWKKVLEQVNKNRIFEYGIAYDKDKIVGFCNSYFDPNQGEIGWINTLGIIPSHQNSGIGSALFASRVEFLQNSGCKKINLPVEAKNKNAIRLYEKFGFYKKDHMTEKTYRLI